MDGQETIAPPKFRWSHMFEMLTDVTFKTPRWHIQKLWACATGYEFDVRDDFDGQVYKITVTPKDKPDWRDRTEG